MHPTYIKKVDTALITEFHKSIYPFSPESHRLISRLYLEGGIAIKMEYILAIIVNELFEKLINVDIFIIAPFSKKHSIAFSKINIEPAIIRLGKPSPSDTFVFRRDTNISLLYI